MNSQEMTIVVIHEDSYVSPRPGRTEPLLSLGSDNSTSFRKKINKKSNKPNKTMLKRIKEALKPRRK